MENHRRSPASHRRTRQSRIEALEARRLMTTDLAPLGNNGNATLYAGAPLHIALDGFDSEGDTLTYEVSVSNSALSAEVLEGNRSLKMSVEGFGDMIFELFEKEAPRTTSRIIQLAQTPKTNNPSAKFYDGIKFHRIVESFMIQGGDPLGNGTGGSGTKFDDEFNALLQHTSSGILSMAKGGDDSNDSQFFITARDTRELDFNHSVFGFLTEGEQVRKEIAKVPVTKQDPTDPDSERSKPVTDVKISSVSVIVDQQNGVLRLSAAPGATGSAVVTVTARDPYGGFQTRTLNVTIASDPVDNYPVLGTISPIQTTVNTPVNFIIPATDVESQAMYFAGAASSSSSGVSITVDPNTGAATVNPGSTPGVFGVNVYVRAQNPAAYYQGRDVWDSQAVPVYVKPAAPIVKLLPQSDTGASNSDGITGFNNTAGKTLQFELSGLVAGARVTLYADGQIIGQTTVPTGASSLTLDTTGVFALGDGPHAITAVQEMLNVAVNVGNVHTTTNLASSASAPLTLRVDTTPPQITSAAVTQAVQGQRYEYDVQANEEADGNVTYTLVHAPSGMEVNAQNGRIVWIPTAGQGGTQSVTVRATDKAGNASEQSFSMTVVSAARLIPIGLQQVNEGQLVRFTVQAEAEQEQLPLVFSLGTGAPAGATIDAQTGEFRWQTAEAHGPGQYMVAVQATTKTGATSSQVVPILVREVNQGPTLAEIVDRTIAEGQTLALTAVASDADIPANSLLYTLLEKPVGSNAQIDPTTGQFTWTPGEADGGYEYTLKIRVTDSAGASAERTFRVKVNEVDEAPRFDPIRVSTATAGERFDFDVRAWDPDLPSREIRYSLESGAPADASIDPVSGHVTWDVPEEDAVRSAIFTIRATEVDEEGQPVLSAVQEVRVPVFDFRLALLDAVLTELNTSGANRTSGIRDQDEDGQPAANDSEETPAELLDSILGQVAAANPTGFVPLPVLPGDPGSDSAIGNESQLLGQFIGPDTGSGGAPSPAPQENEAKQKDQQPANQDGEQGDSGQPQNKAAEPIEDSQQQSSRTTEETSPNAHDAAVAALAEEIRLLVLPEPETPPAPEPSEPVPVTEPAATEQAEESSEAEGSCRSGFPA